MRRAANLAEVREDSRCKALIEMNTAKIVFRPDHFAQHLESTEPEQSWFTHCRDGRSAELCSGGGQIDELEILIRADRHDRRWKQYRRPL